jgi:membrane protease YdiL (CAAX protease family)
LRAVLVAAAAIFLCGLAVWYGPPLAETLAGLLPAGQSPPMLETLFSLTIFGSLLVFALVGGAATRSQPLRPGERPTRMALLGLAAGAFGIAMATGYAAFHGTLSQAPVAAPDPALLLWGGGLVLFQSTAEEAYFRGWLQPVLARHWGDQAAILVAALAFAALHVMGGARSPVTLINLFLGGLLFGCLAAQGRGIAGAVAAHFSWNASEQLLLGLDPNPGLGSFGALTNLELTGAAIWGGSEEGLNASLVMTAALALLIVPLLLARRRKGRATA